MGRAYGNGWMHGRMGIINVVRREAEISLVMRDAF